MKRPEDKVAELEWIERYLANDLLPNERQEVEQIMEEDQNFALEVQQIKKTHEMMQQAFLAQRALSTLKRLQADSNRQRSRRQRVLQWTGALAVSGVAAMLFLLFAPIQFPSSENDYSLTRGSESRSLVKEQRVVFEQFFEGQAHIAEGQYVLAAKNFEQVLQSNNIRPYFKEAAQWHLAVAYLRSGQTAKAERIYRSLADCADCEYPISTLDRWKIWWQIKRAKFTN